MNKTTIGIMPINKRAPLNVLSAINPTRGFKKTMSQLQFDAEDKKIEDLFEKDKYIIPRYQRPYSWTITEIEDLWNDLTQDDSTFIGSWATGNGERTTEA